MRRTAYRLYKLLRGLSAMKHLTISYYILEVVLADAPELLGQLPLFSDLTTLELASSIDIGSKGLEEPSNVAEDGILEPLPPCLLSHLKTIEVYEFYGEEDHVHALIILFKNAKALKKMTITWGTVEKMGPERKTDVNKHLFDLPRVSESCELVITS